MDGRDGRRTPKQFLTHSSTNELSPAPSRPRYAAHLRRALLSAYITTNSVELTCIAGVDGEGGADFLKTVDEGEGEKAQGHFTSLATECNGTVSRQKTDLNINRIPPFLVL